MKVEVTKQAVTVTEQSVICEGDYCVNECIFHLPECFNGLSVTAVFNNIPVPLTDGKCIIPSLNKGNGVLGVYAYKKDSETDEVKLMYSPEPCAFWVSDGSYTEEVAAEETPEISRYEEYCDMLRAYCTEYLDKASFGNEEELKKCEKLINKVTSLSENSTDDEYPTAKAVYQVVSTFQRAVAEELLNSEKTENKTETLSEESTNEQYPTAKAVYDYIENNTSQEFDPESQKPQSGIAVAEAVKPFGNIVINSENLFDKNAEGITEGHYIMPTTGAEMTSYENIISDYIPVKYGSTYSTKVNYKTLGANAANIAVYNKDKEYIGYLKGSLDSTADVYSSDLTFTVDDAKLKIVDETVNSIVSYVRLSVYRGNVDTHMMVEGHFYPSKYIEYSTFLNEKIKIPQLDEYVKSESVDQAYKPESEKSQSGIAVAQAVEPLNEKIENINQELSNYEKSENKTGNIDENSTDTEYPSAKAVYDYVENNTSQGFDPESEKPQSGMAVAEAVSKITESLSSVVQTEIFKGGNLFNKNSDEILVYKHLNTSGELIDSDYGAVTHYIPVEVGKNYTTVWDTSRYGTTARMHLYDKDFNWLGVVYAYPPSEQSATPATFTVKTEGAVYCRLNCIASQIDNYKVVEGDTYPDEYLVYGDDRYETTIKNEAINSPLKGKMISFNGDSICAGAGFKGGYGKIIADRCGMEYENIGVSGGTVMYSGEDRHCISRTVVDMCEDADYIILEGGVNDLYSDRPLGSISDGYNAELDDTTFYGAFENMLKQALIRFPGKKIGYIAVHKMTDYFSSEVTENSAYYAALECCKKWGIPVCDLNISCPPFAKLKANNETAFLADLYTADTDDSGSGDGWHPNEEGYLKYYCDPIEKWLETL